MSGNYDFPDPEWSEVSDEAKDFIKKILVVDAGKRMSASDCLAHPWITQGAKKALKRIETFNVQKFKEYVLNGATKETFTQTTNIFLSFSITGIPPSTSRPIRRRENGIVLCCNRCFILFSSHDC
jgi:serine/threonine protein kinase